MARTIIICGHGPGISKAVAEKFGAEGFSVALVARSADKLAAGVKALEAQGVKAAGFSADLGDPAAARDAVKRARAALGPITDFQSGDTAKTSENIRESYEFWRNTQ